MRTGGPHSGQSPPNDAVLRSAILGFAAVSAIRPQPACIVRLFRNRSSLIESVGILRDYQEEDMKRTVVSATLVVMLMVLVGTTPGSALGGQQPPAKKKERHPEIRKAIAAT